LTGTYFIACSAKKGKLDPMNAGPESTVVKQKNVGQSKSTERCGTKKAGLSLNEDSNFGNSNDRDNKNR